LVELSSKQNQLESISPIKEYSIPNAT